MGNQNEKSNRNKIKEKNLENKDKYNITKNLNIKNPFFKNIQTISKENCIGFEIYQLKSKNNSIYIAFLSESHWIIFYKYIDKTKIFKEISRLKINTRIVNHIIQPQIKLKYFYNPLNKKEYIFISRCNEEIIEIYLINDENKYENINIEYKGIKRKGYDTIISVDLFEVFYNEYDKNIYVIVSYIKHSFCCVSEIPDIIKYFDIIKLKEKKMKLIKTFTFDLTNNGDVLNLIYENDKNYYIIVILNNNIQIIDINKLKVENLIPINNKLCGFLKLECRPKFEHQIVNDFKPYSIIKVMNKDYLYISKYKSDDKGYKRSDLVIIDLFKKEIFKFINLNICVNSFVKWNDNNIIFMCFDSFYIFDINSYQITTKYSGTGNYTPIYYAKPFFSKEHKFYCLFLLLFRKLKFYFNNN